MRDYKFRGINKLTKDVWEYGAYVPGGTTIAGVRDHTIVSPGCYATEVKSETVGQFTGLKDKNGVEIYEGDIATKGYTSFGVMNGIVKIIHGCWMVTRDDNDDHYWNLHHYLDVVEVIGNIHLNPELLETQHA